MEMTRRVKVHTGFRCNANCRFCYYHDSLNAANPPTEEVKAKLKRAKKRGIKDIDFSGGEPTLKSDFLELVSYARSLGFRRICVITNGIRLGDKDHFIKAVDSGLNEVLFSIEGHNREVHDYLTRVPGSFEKISRAMAYAREYGLRLRTNTTVTSFNYKSLPDLASYLIEFGPEAVNFILFNDWCSAYDAVRDMACRYGDAAPFLRSAIDILAPAVPKVSARYIPFCFLVGYERHICNLLQKKCDPDEWDDAVKTELLGELDISFSDPRYWIRPARRAVRSLLAIVRLNFKLREYRHDREVEIMQKGYTKRPECRQCRFFLICDGLENGYVESIGLDELKPVPGPWLSDPFHFRKEYVN
jgi:sulfatase maturation enzyme AslB (radical SAM superfamily)